MNTHESYVSLETAKMLKEAGFNQVRREYYYNFTTTGWSLSFDDDFVNWNSWGERHISAPTLDVAQRWLREVKNWEVNIITICKSSKTYSYVIFTDAYKSERIEEDFSTYEEAQEAGIQKCLEILLNK